MKAARLMIAAMVAASVWTVALPAASPVSADASAVRSSDAGQLRFKALSDLAIRIDTGALEVGQPVPVALGARAGFVATSVILSSTGNVGVDPVPADVVFAGQTAATVGRLTSITGAGTVTAVITGRGVEGQPVVASDTVWVDVVDGVVVASHIGSQDLGLRVVSAWEIAGQMSEDAADAAREVVLKGAPAAEGPVLSAGGACATDLICVTGTARWTDSNGNVHPVREALVEAVVAGGDSGSASTTETGDFTITLAAPPSASDVDVRMIAEGPGFRVGFDADPAFGVLDYRVHEVVVPTAENVVGGTAIDASMTTLSPADPFADTNHTAFSLHNAMLVAREFLPTVQAAPFPDVDVLFPSFGSFYDGQRLNMLAEDRWDWDVMLHEYGHFIADQLGIDANPGGSHSSSENLGDRLPKVEANRLAWGEGWPTYFGVSLLVDSDAASLNIPDVGDTRYQDTEDASIDYDLEGQLDLGEDNEATTSAILWDLYDEAQDGLDAISLGSQAVWNVLDEADPESLSEAYAAFAPNGGAGTNLVNCVFSQLNVSPLLAGLSTTTIDQTTTSPTLDWSSGNGGNFGENDVFEVEFRNATNNLRLHTSGPISETSYTASSARWAAVVAGAGGTVNVTVTGTETREPTTGPYRSCARQFVGGPPAPPALFISIDPRRFADTRLNGETFDGEWEGDGQRSGGGDPYVIDFAGRGDVPDGARAVVANLTAVRAAGVGFVTAFDCSLPRPVTSSLNYTSGVNLGNEVIVTLNAAGEACLFTSADTDLTVDVVGYVAADSPFESVDPARLFDTRTNGQQTIDREFEAEGRTPAGGQTSVTISGRGGVPADAAAAVVNVTAVGAQESGFVTVHPCLDVLPLAASLNYVSGANRGNELIVPLDDDGDICMFTSTSVHLTIDVVGYVSPPSNLQATEPARFLDTRGSGSTIDGDDEAGGKRSAGSQYTLQITGRNGIPESVGAVIINVTAVQPEGTGFVTVHACESSLPTASSLNHVDLVNGGNEIIAKLDDDGQVCLFTSNSTHLTVDVTGYLGL